jgi:molybdate transport system substrate-binding protein
MPSTRWRAGASAPALVLALAALLGSTPAAAEPEKLRVLAAASLTEVVEALAKGFPDARVETVFGASSELARQIRDGAPADVFVSASPDWVDYLREAGAVAGQPIVIARNRLVCIASKKNAVSVWAPREPRALLAQLAPDDRVAIADEGVPAGEYTRAALRSLGLADEFAPRLVGQKDVRAVLHAVESDELPAGFVYATDAKTADVAVLFGFDPLTHPPIEYQAAALRGSARPGDARRFLDHLRGESARALLAGAGFALP